MSLEVSNYDYIQGLFNTLTNIYHQATPKQFWDGYGYDRKDDYGFLGSVTPTIDTDQDAADAKKTQPFFGPKVFTILMLSRPYGSEPDPSDSAPTDWPPQALIDQIKKIVASYSTWSYYAVWLYVDYSIVSAIRDSGADDADTKADDYSTALDTFADKLETLINDGDEDNNIEPLTKVGFVYKGKLKDNVEANHFTDAYDYFYKNGTTPDE